MSVIGAYSHILYNREVYQQHHHQYLLVNGGGYLCSPKSGCGNIWIEGRNRERKIRRNLRVEANWWPDLSRPSTIEMKAINDCEQLDQILQHAQQNSQLVLIDWMAAWCRKCIYLKPKLEKLAAEFDTNYTFEDAVVEAFNYKIKINHEWGFETDFYYVDVNKVPQSLVKRGNVSKMPTIQLWKDGEMKAEVIGGHKGWLVIEEVREMIQKFL